MLVLYIIESYDARKLKHKMMNVFMVNRNKDDVDNNIVAYDNDEGSLTVRID